jgi:hypothetical protein
LRVQGDWKNLWNIHTSRFVEHAYQQEWDWENTLCLVNGCAHCARRRRIGHVLFECVGSTKCWVETELSGAINPRLQRFRSTKELILDICNKEEREVVGKVALLACVIWIICGIITRFQSRQLGVQTNQMCGDWSSVQGVQREAGGCYNAAYYVVATAK